MILVVVSEKNTHAMTLVDPCVVSKENTHAMTLVVVSKKNIVKISENKESFHSYSFLDAR